MIYADWIKKFNNYLENTEVISNGSKLSIGEGFDQLVDISLRAKQNNNTMFIAGNGASASLAAHLATDLWVHAGVKTSTFHEINQVTALANDFGYEEVYSRPLEMFSQAGDVLIIISGSGESTNILKSLDKAKELGLFTISFTGFESDNPSRESSDLSFWTPGDTYGFIESSHSVLAHYWIDMMIELTGDAG